MLTCPAEIVVARACVCRPHAAYVLQPLVYTVEAHVGAVAVEHIIHRIGVCANARAGGVVEVGAGVVGCFEHHHYGIAFGGHRCLRGTHGLLLCGARGGHLGHGPAA